MGGKASKVSNAAEELGGARKDTGSVIDKLTEAQLDEFREAFNSFDKVREATVAAAAPQNGGSGRPRFFFRGLRPQWTADVMSPRPHC